MKPKVRELNEPGSKIALDSGLSQQLEHILAEDARTEAAILASERDALAEALRRSQAELHLRSGEVAALRTRLADAETRLDARDASGSARSGELGLAESNEFLLRLNNELERRIAERTAALAESETRLRAATDVVPHLVWTSGAGGRWTWANRRWVEYTGMDASESVGFGWLDPVHPDDRDATMAAWRGAEAAGEMQVEHRLRAADGAYRRFATRALPERRGPEHEDGPLAAPALWHGTSTDVEDARRAETALCDSEARFRGFAETSPDVLWIADASGRKLEYLSPAYEQVWGERRDAVIEDLRRWGERLHPEDRAAALECLPKVLRGERVEAEYRIRRASDGAVRWIRDIGFPIRDAAGRVQRAAGLAQDVTDQREAERHHKLLLHELNHRVKNALAGAQAIAAHTARGGGEAASPGDFLPAFEARLMALARAHDMLTREGWRGAPLADVVHETLAPHSGDAAGRVSASGPAVRLVPGAAVALHMAFHELAANAARYGALSAPAGRVEVGWSIVRAAGDAGAPAVLDIAWRECGGPPVAAPPARTGFGTRLLERGLTRQLGGVARIDFRPDGVEFQLRLPLSSRVEAK